MLTHKCQRGESKKKTVDAREEFGFASCFLSWAGPLHCPVQRLAAKTHVAFSIPTEPLLGHRLNGALLTIAELLEHSPSRREAAVHWLSKKAVSVETALSATEKTPH